MYCYSNKQTKHLTADVLKRSQAPQIAISKHGWWKEVKVTFPYHLKTGLIHLSTLQATDAALSRNEMLSQEKWEGAASLMFCFNTTWKSSSQGICCTSQQNLRRWRALCARPRINPLNTASSKKKNMSTGWAPGWGAVRQTGFTVN